MVTPFTIDIADEVLDDLRNRIRNTRWPEAETVDDWSQGMPLAYTQELATYWAETYDWRAREKALNRFDQFTTTIDGLELHFVHHRSPHPDATPLLLTHGWPGSIVEFHKVIEPLTNPDDPADAFHVVAPSLPGYGFSAKPTEPGWGVEKFADLFARLMAMLGYDRYLAQGGDWGSAITTAIGATDTEHCAAAHITLAFLGIGAPDDPPTPQQQRSMDGMAYYGKWGNGYSAQQSTRPQTLGYGLVDSPVGQMAWVVEKFYEWTDCTGPDGTKHPEHALDRDELLDNVMLYWLNGNGASSGKLYWESFRNIATGTIQVPTGITAYPAEIFPPVKEWCEAAYPHLTYFNEQPRGGHFSAFEVPDLFVDDIRAWARSTR